jgi:hypothetical protein
MDSSIDSRWYGEAMKYIAIAFVLALFIAAPAAHAQAVPGTGETMPENTDPCGSGSIATSPCWASGPGSSYTACVAVGSSNERCWYCGQNRYGKLICVLVAFSAQCSCKDEPVPGAGPGITSCVAEGSCAYYAN